MKKILSVETNGVEIIPDHQRTSTTNDLFRLIFGGANTFATVVLGSFPIIFGLSLQAGLAAIFIGVVIGSVILSPMALFGPQNGTNNAVSSGAHFGIHGRIVGSFLSLLTAVTFFSLSVWSSGDALMGALKRIVHVTENDINLACLYAFFAIVVLLICIYGFHLLVSVSKLAVAGATLMFVLGIPAFSGSIDWQFSGQIRYGDDGFWPVFAGAVMIAMSNPISFGAFLGDWSRYIPKETPKWKIMRAVYYAQLATLLPFYFGLVTASVVALNAPEYIAQNNYIGGLLAISPQWYFIPLCIIAFVGGLSTGTTALYGTGLDISSIFPRVLRRVSATILIGLLSIIFIFVGRFVFNLTMAVSTFAVLIITCTSPWITIMVIGYIQRKGYYSPDDLQVFNRGQRGGIYWFHHGWNWRGMAAWIPSAVLGMLFVNIPGQFVGPLGKVFHNIDFSLLITLCSSAVLYLLFTKIFPEPAEVFGPVKPRSKEEK